MHLAYVREKTGHALAGARRVPAEDIADPVRSLVTGLPLDLRFRTKGQLAMDILADAYADGLVFDFACGDEVYGSCTELREFLEDQGQAYVLRVASSFMLTLAGGAKVTCSDAVNKLLKGKKGWEVRSAGKGAKGERWYAWAWLATASARHSLLVRRHLKTGELAFHYCFVPDGSPRPGPADQGSGAEMAGRGKLRAGQRLLRAGPVPGPPLHRDPAPPGTGDGRASGLRGHRRPAQGPRHSRGRTAAALTCPRRPTPAWSRCQSARSSSFSQPPCTARSSPATPSAGSNGGSATRHDPAGSTNVHAWHATTPWSASNCRLPY